MVCPKIVITGSTGFVGSTLLKYLEKKKFGQLYLLKRDKHHNLRDWDYVKSFKQATGEVDFIIHLAASPNTFDFMDINSVFENNYASTKNVIKGYYNTKHIFMSSIMVYGGVYNKDNVKNPRPSSIYAASKIACENLYEVANHQYGTKALIVRSGALVGPNMTHGLTKDIEEKIRGKGKYLELYGKSPGAKKSYTHISDFCRYIHHQLLHHDFKENEILPVNFCNSGAVSVKRVAEILMQDLKKEKTIMFNPNKGSKTGIETISVCGDEDFEIKLNSEEAIRKRNVYSF